MDNNVCIEFCEGSFPIGYKTISIGVCIEIEKYLHDRIYEDYEKGSKIFADIATRAFFVSDIYGFTFGLPKSYIEGITIEPDDTYEGTLDDCVKRSRERRKNDANWNNLYEYLGDRFVTVDIGNGFEGVVVCKVSLTKTK